MLDPRPIWTVYARARCGIRNGDKKGLRCRNSPTCTLSQNGYGTSNRYLFKWFAWRVCYRRRRHCGCCCCICPHVVDVGHLVVAPCPAGVVSLFACRLSTSLDTPSRVDARDPTTDVIILLCCSLSPANGNWLMTRHQRRERGNTKLVKTNTRSKRCV